MIPDSSGASNNVCDVNDTSDASNSGSDDDGEESEIGGPDESMEWQDLFEQSLVKYDAVWANTQFDERHDVRAECSSEQTQCERLVPTAADKAAMRQWEVSTIDPILEAGQRQSTFTDFGQLQRYKGPNSEIRVVPLSDAFFPNLPGWLMLDIDGYRVFYTPLMRDMPINTSSVKIGDEDNFLQDWC